MVVSAYIAEHSFKGLRSGDAERLTHINIAFAVIKDGKGSIDHWANGDAIKQLIKDNGHIKVVLSVGGWGAGGFSPAVATAEGRELLSQSLVDIVDEYGFDGLDLDWEYPCSSAASIESSTDDKVNYTLWVQLLRQKLGAHGLLTMACGATQKCASDLEITKLVNVLDYFNLMTYDMCPWDKVGHHADLYASAQVANVFADAGVPWEKLVLGAAFYARVYKDVDGIDAPLSGPLEYNFLRGGYAETAARAQQIGLSYDTKAKAPYIYDANTREFITFDNPQSLKDKVDYVKANNMAGVMFWAYAFDDEDSTLLRAIAGK